MYLNSNFTNFTNLARFNQPEFVTLDRYANKFPNPWLYLSKMRNGHVFKIVGRHVNDDGTPGALIGNKVVIINSRTDPNSIILGRCHIVNSTISNCVIANTSVACASLSDWFYNGERIDNTPAPQYNMMQQNPVMQPQYMPMEQYYDYAPMQYPAPNQMQVTYPANQVQTSYPNQLQLMYPTNPTMGKTNNW